MFVCAARHATPLQLHPCTSSWHDSASHSPGWRLCAVTSSRASLERKETRLTIKQHNSLRLSMTGWQTSSRENSHSYPVRLQEGFMTSTSFGFLHPLNESYVLRDIKQHNKCCGSDQGGLTVLLTYRAGNRFLVNVGFWNRLQDKWKNLFLVDMRFQKLFACICEMHEMFNHLIISHMEFKSQLTRVSKPKKPTTPPPRGFQPCRYIWLHLHFQVQDVSVEMTLWKQVFEKLFN